MTLAPEQANDRAARLSAALAAATVETLISKYRYELKFRDFAVDSDTAALRLAAELDRRGIAPAFRVNLEVFEADPFLVEHVGLCDLRWLRHRYPEHKPAWSRLREVFSRDDDRATKAQQFALYDGRRPAAQLIKALALTIEQQSELAWIASAPVRSRRRVIDNQRQRTAECIASSVHDSRDRRSDADKEATIARRVALWECAMLAGWSPTRTAELFAMMPQGIALTRNAIGNQLTAIKKATMRRKHNSTKSI